MPTLQSAQESAEEMRQLVMSVFTDTERACVILGVAFIEKQLTQALLKLLHPSSAKALEYDELFGVDKFWGSFEAKTRLAWRLRLIDEKFKSGLKLIAALRNKFAHTPEQITLSQDPYKGKVMTLRDYAKNNPVYKQVEQALHQKKNGPLRLSFEKISIELIYFIAVISAMNASLKVVTDDNECVTLNNLASFHVIITDG